MQEVSNSQWSDAFHFIPTDKHLVMFLQDRLSGLQVPGIQGITIKDVNVYEDLTPREIFAKSELWGPSEADKERYCFTELKRTTKGGKRFVRTTGGGTWRLQNSEKIDGNNDGNALKRTFTYKPKNSGASGADDCGWAMYEYSLIENPIQGTNINQDIAICKVRKTSSKKRGRSDDDEDDETLQSAPTKFQSTRYSDIDFDNAMHHRNLAPTLNEDDFYMGPAPGSEDNMMDSTPASSTACLDDLKAHLFDQDSSDQQMHHGKLAPALNLTVINVDDFSIGSAPGSENNTMDSTLFVPASSTAWLDDFSMGSAPGSEDNTMDSTLFIPASSTAWLDDLKADLFDEDSSDQQMLDQHMIHQRMLELDGLLKA